MVKTAMQFEVDYVDGNLYIKQLDLRRMDDDVICIHKDQIPLLQKWIKEAEEGINNEMV